MIVSDLEWFITKEGKKFLYFTTEVSPSPAEGLIMKVLKSLSVEYIREVSFTHFKSPRGGYYRYDFFLPKQNLIIEYDGAQYHINNPNDKIKNRFCKKNKISLIRLNSVHYYCMKDTLSNLLLNHKNTNMKSKGGKKGGKKGGC